MLYICTHSFRHIPEGALVIVEIGPQVYITFDKHTSCTTEFVLAMNFERMEN